LFSHWQQHGFCFWEAQTLALKICQALQRHRSYNIGDDLYLLPSTDYNFCGVISVANNKHCVHLGQVVKANLLTVVSVAVNVSKLALKISWKKGAGDTPKSTFSMENAPFVDAVQNNVQMKPYN